MRPGSDRPGDRAGSDRPADRAGSEPAIRAAQEHARQLLEVIAHLPVALAAAASTRAIHSAVRDAVTQLLGEVRALELFLVEGPTGAVVPSGEPREGVPLLDALWAAGEPLTQQPALLAPSKYHGEILSIPVLDRAGPLGVLVIEAEAGARRFRGSDIDDMTLLGMQLIVALQRLHLERRAAAHRRVERDMVLAREVQRSFLPPPVPVTFGLRIEAHYRPAHDVGGDFYDVAVNAESGAATFIVGDVSGRGVAAALMMARVTADLRDLLRRGQEPHAILEALDSFMALQDDPELLATALCWRIEADGQVLAANAGQAAPFLRPAKGPPREVVLASGPPLGSGSQGWRDERFQLDDGDTLFAFTDGLIDAIAAPEAMNELTLHTLLGEGPHAVDAICARVLMAVERQRLLRPVDDLTLVAVQVVR